MDLIKELIPVLPSILWVVLAAIVFWFLYNPIIVKLLPALTGLKVGEVELLFAKHYLDAATTAGKEHDLKLAEKDEKWKIFIPDTDRDRVLKRVSRHMNQLKGGEILWIDDIQANNTNERETLKQFDMKIYPVSNTEEALQELEKRSFDLILSDIGRENPETSGLDVRSK